MTDISVTIEDADDDEVPQVDQIRSEYVDGNYSEEELEELLEWALDEGPGIGKHKDRTSVDASIMEQFGVWAAAIINKPFVKLLDLKIDNGTISYSVQQHWITAVDEDPDPDDHPAQNAGSMQTFLTFFPIMVYYLLGALVLSGNSGAGIAVLVSSLIVGVMFFGLAVLASLAPKPRVEVTDKGVGTHVAE